MGIGGRLMREIDRGARAYLATALLLFAIPAALWLVSPGEAASLPSLARALPVLGRSLLVAAGAAAIAVVAGGGLGVLFSAYRIPARGALTPLLLAPFLLPAVVVTTGVQAWWAEGPSVVLVRGVPGAILLSAVQMTPLVLWGVARSLGAIPEAERAAMRVTLPPVQVTRLLAGRALPVAARLGALAFLLLLPRLEVPAYTGIETIGRRTLAAFTAEGSDLEGWLWCAACLAIALPVLPFATRPLAVDAAPVSLGRPDRTAPRSRWATAISFAAAAVPVALLVGLVADATAGGPTGGVEAGRWAGALARELLRVVPLAVGIAVLGWRIGLGVGRVGTALAALALFLPGALPALVWIEGMAPFLPAFLADTEIPLDLVQGFRFLGVAVLLGRLADRAIPSAERASAAFLPASRARWRVRFPRALPGLAASAVLLSALILGEVESAAQIAPPGRLLPSVELHQLLHYRYDVQAARLSLAIAAATGILVAGLGRIGREREEVA